MINNLSNKELGSEGENFAVTYLENIGFVILERNFRFKRCEIDIIAKRDDCVHFIEVKYRNSNRFGYPEDFVSEQQKERIKLAADNFIYLKKWEGNIKFDIISIEKKRQLYIPIMFEDSF